MGNGANVNNSGEPYDNMGTANTDDVLQLSIEGLFHLRPDSVSVMNGRRIGHIKKNEEFGIAALMNMTGVHLSCVALQDSDREYRSSAVHGIQIRITASTTCAETDFRQRLDLFSFA
jgi:hypothetical protein